LSRTFILGANDPLLPRTTYWYRLHCGGAFEQGSFTTAEPRTSETADVLRVRRKAEPGAAATVELEWGTSYSRASDTISGGQAVPVACDESICTAGFTAPGSVVAYYRLRRTASGGESPQTGGVRVRPVAAP
jgi:hypothetical protein